MEHEIWRKDRVRICTSECCKSQKCEAENRISQEHSSVCLFWLFFCPLTLWITFIIRNFSTSLSLLQLSFEQLWVDFTRNALCFKELSLHAAVAAAAARLIDIEIMLNLCIVCHCHVSQSHSQAPSLIHPSLPALLPSDSHLMLIIPAAFFFMPAGREKWEGQQNMTAISLHLRSSFWLSLHHRRSSCFRSLLLKAGTYTITQKGYTVIIFHPKNMHPCLLHERKWSLVWGTRGSDNGNPSAGRTIPFTYGIWLLQRRRHSMMTSAGSFFFSLLLSCLSLTSPEKQTESLRETDLGKR